MDVVVPHRPEMMAGYAAGKWVPAAGLMVQVTGAVIVLRGFTVVSADARADLGPLLLAACVVSAALLIGGLWRETDPASKTTKQIRLPRGLSIAGAALAVFAFFAAEGDGADVVVLGRRFTS